jgi:hypothetical protein
MGPNTGISPRLSRLDFVEKSQRALFQFSPLKKVPKLTEGSLFHPFFGLFWEGFGPEKQLFGWVLGIK